MRLIQSLILLFISLGILFFLCNYNVSRWWRLLLFPLILYSIGLGCFSIYGICSILNLQNKKEIKPWENKYENNNINTIKKIAILLNIPIIYRELPIIEDKKLLKVLNIRVRKCMIISSLISIILLIILLIVPENIFY